MTNIKNKMTLTERIKTLVFNKVTPVLSGYETGILSGGDIPIFRCPACGREFTTGQHCRCGVKFDWSRFKR
ncbi:MAG: hypothetical protein HGA87_01740 [Desulfobulbaceae bacterium]|nr:hypothetical protein [Desulfobulbaceae bacterium]